MKNLSLKRWLRGEVALSIWDGVFVLAWIGELVAAINWRHRNKKNH